MTVTSERGGSSRADRTLDRSRGPGGCRLPADGPGSGTVLSPCSALTAGASVSSPVSWY